MSGTDGNTRTDGISFFDKDELCKQINIIIGQTNYTEEEANKKLQTFNYDYMKVIKDYMGIHEKKDNTVKSVNQEIYKQIRTTLDSSMKGYREKNPINVDQVASNFQESDERKNKYTIQIKLIFLLVRIKRIRCTFYPII